jgi:hypothetical protein
MTNMSDTAEIVPFPPEGLGKSGNQTPLALMIAVLDLMDDRG